MYLYTLCNIYVVYVIHKDKAYEMMSLISIMC